MSCESCGSTAKTQANNGCYEARLSLGVVPDSCTLAGTLDGIPIEPVPLKEAIRHCETNTSLKFDPETCSLVYMSEKATKDCSIGDIIPVAEIMACASLDDLTGVGGFVDGGLASAKKVGNELQMVFEVPTNVEAGEDPSGFLVYVAEPNGDNGHYKLLAPQTGTGGNSVLIGKPDGTIEFANPIASPLVVPLAALNAGGVYAGTPVTVIDSWYFQELGTSQIITNTDSSPVQVTLSLRMAIKGGAAFRGAYAGLVNGGSDYKQEFVEGGGNIKQELGSGGQATWSAVLQPNQKAQFKFGVYSSVSAVEAVVGNFTATSHEVRLPIIDVRRLA